MSTSVRSKLLMQQVPSDFVDLASLGAGLKLEPRYAGPDNFTGHCVPGYESGRLLLTQAAAQALLAVQKELGPAGFALKIFDAYRPQRAVDYFLHWVNSPDDARLKALYYPDINKAELFELGYLVKNSSHSRGSTVDLTLIDIDSGAELDMGTPFDFFDERSRPDCTAVSMMQAANRMRLRSAMLQQGFEPLAEEWWHFTLCNEPYPDTAFDF